MKSSSGKVSPKSEMYRSIPSVNLLLRHPAVTDLMAQKPRSVVTQAARHVVNEIRRHIQEHDEWPGDLSLDDLAERVAAETNPGTPCIDTVEINASGIVFPDEINMLSSYDPRGIEPGAGHETGDSEIATTESLIAEFTSAEDACLINHRFTAIRMVMRVLARGKEVVVCRGQMGSESGTSLQDLLNAEEAGVAEVGSTNKTRVADYRAAIHADTGAVLYARPQTYGFKGFSQDVPAVDLARMGLETGVPIIYSVGMTPMVRVPGMSRAWEWSVGEAIEAGVAAVITGGSLAGVPGCALVAGRHAILGPLKQTIRRSERPTKQEEISRFRHHLKNFDRETGGLAHFAEGRSLLCDLSEIASRRNVLLTGLREALPTDWLLEPVDTDTFLTDARLPEEKVKSAGISLKPPITTANRLSEALRTATTPVLNHVAGGCVVLDLRTVSEQQFGTLTSVLENTCV